jgi:hypothetical protein
MTAATGLSGCAHAQIGPGVGSEPFVLTIAPDDSLDFQLIKNGVSVASIDMIGWGPNWAYSVPSATGCAQNGVLDVTAPFRVGQDDINIEEHVSQAGPKTIVLQYKLTAQRDETLTQLSDAFKFNENGSITTILKDGTAGDTLVVPTVRSAYASEISRLDIALAGVGRIGATFDPALSPHVENGELRMRLLHDSMAAGTVTETITLTFPDNVRFAADKGDIAGFTKHMADDNWFTFDPTNDVGPSVIGMEGWLDGPAGKHGGVRIVGDHFAFADGTPVKFWGTNLAYAQNCPDKNQAEQTAARFAKYGINCVRMHKFTNPGEGIGTNVDTLTFDPVGLDKFDYFTAQLEKHGVYFGWSHSYHYKVRPGDEAKLLNYNEIKTQLGSDTYGLMNAAPDVQNLNIAMVVSLLKHRNPYTGKTYAQDPALAWLEVQNEDDIFFYTFGGAIDKCPTYKQALMQRFGDWLKAKYSTQAALAKAWGHELGANEKIGGPMDVQTNPWFFGDDGLKQGDSFHRQRLLDNADFFHAEQDRYYKKFVAAVRGAGYLGPINGSPWWAPTTVPQYYNLKSDAQTGYVDRHNYFGGKLWDTMLADPGSGYLNTGLVRDGSCPFTLSEWCHVYPSVYSAEGPAIMAAYGLGLQGWNGSYEFQSFSNNGGFQPDEGHEPWNIWSCDVPNQIGQFPTLSRMIYRGDVKEGDVIAVKRVSDDNLLTGKFDFSDTMAANGDVKNYGGNVPQESLAAGRVEVLFPNQTTPSTFPNLALYDKNKVITSTTKQLVWDYSGNGYFKVLTPGTVGVVGFAEDVPVGFAGMSIRLHSPYASIFVTSLDRNKPLATCAHALVSVVGRECNTGLTYYGVDGHVLENGKGPILVEGIKADLAVSGRAISAVNVLDVDGRRQSGQTLRVAPGGNIALDTGRDHTIYYEIVFGK